MTDSDYLAELRLIQCAEKLRRSASSGPKGPTLPEPVVGCDALGQVEGTLILSWMLFNPFGPSLCTLFHATVPGSKNGDSILAFNSSNPFQEDWWAYLLLAGHLSAAEVISGLEAVFVENGHSSAPLFLSLPTSVFHADNWPRSDQPPLINGSQARSLLRAAVQKIDAPDFQTTNEYLRRYKGDPWERTAAELQEGLLKALIRTKEVEVGFDLAAFEEWFDLVTDPVHVRSEWSNLRAAWEGAIENSRGSYR